MTLRRTVHRAQLSCDHCRRNKRKCDRLHPCARCRSDRAECTYHRAHATRTMVRGARRQTDTSLAGPSTLSTSATTSTPRTSSSTDTRPTSLTTSPVWPPPSNRARAQRSVPVAQHERQSADLDLVVHFLDRPRVIQRMFDIYMREVDWLLDLLVDTRIVKVIQRYNEPRAECPPTLWDALQPLVLVVAALVSQTCPIEVDSVIVTSRCLQLIASHSIESADQLAGLAYTAAKRQLADLSISGDPCTWPAEHFAASMLLRVFEKNVGMVKEVHEGVLLDAQRLQQAGLHQEPQSMHSNSLRAGHAGDWIMKDECNLLAYRIFWAYFEKDRVVSWFSRAGYTIHSRHCHICLRDPAHGHFTIEQLSDVASTSTSDANQSCTCKQQTEDQTRFSADLPRLTMFGAMQARIGAMLGRCFDRSAALRSTTFRWPEDAERLAESLDAEINVIRRQISEQSDRDPLSFKRAQLAILELTLAEFRTAISRFLCNEFAQTLLKQGAARATISWMLQRRRSEANIELIANVLSVTQQLATYSVSWIFFPMFVFGQINDLTDTVKPWFESSSSSSSSSIADGAEVTSTPDAAVRNTSGSMHDHLMSCFEMVLVARNVMVLLTRHNALKEAKRIMRQTSDDVYQLMRRTGCFDPAALLELRDEVKVVNEQRLMSTIRASLSPVPVNVQQHAPISISTDQPHLAPTLTTDSIAFASPFGQHGFDELNADLEADLEKLFADLPNLEKILRSSDGQPEW